MKKDTKLNKFARFRGVNNIKTCEKVTDNNLVIIGGVVAGRQLKILIDNGSQAELISKQTALELGLKIRKSDIQLATPSSELRVLGEVDLNLTIAGHNTNVIAQVVDGLSTKYDIILGLGWLNTYQTQFITEPGKTPVFKLDNTEIPIIKENISYKDVVTTVNLSNSCEDTIDIAKCATDMVIPPRSVGFIKLKIPYNEKLIESNKLIHFQEINHVKDNTDEYGDNTGPQNLFKFQPGVIKVKLSGNNRLYCHVTYSNLSEENIHLSKNQTIGNLSLVEEVILDNNDTNLIHTVTENKSNVKDKDYTNPSIRLEYIKGLLKGKCSDTRSQQLLEQLFRKYPNIVKCPGEILGHTDALEHDILYQGPKVIYKPPYKKGS